MKAMFQILAMVLILTLTTSCATYKATPMPFRVPSSYPNATEVGGAVVAAEAFVDPKRAEQSFGFNVRGAGFLPVEVVFDNQRPHPLRINPQQTFLEDEEGNLWPVLSDQMAYERATRYAQTKQIFKEGAYGAFLGATAGALIGAAVGIVTGGGVGEALGRGAAVGAAAGGTLGGAKGYGSDEARRIIVNDLNQKSLKNQSVSPNSLAYGFIFFPGEAQSAKQLRLQLVEEDTGKVHTVRLKL